MSHHKKVISQQAVAQKEQGWLWRAKVILAQAD
jgi:hypothetical protein